MKYDFDSVIDRHNTNSVKWDYVEKYFNEKDLLPMWVADMDFRAPAPIIEAVRKVADFGIFGYSGVPRSYFESVIDWMKKRHNWDVKKEWISLSPGVVPALHALVNSYTQPGDQVILQTPIYFPFFDAVNSNKREVLDNPLRLEGDQYVMDLEDLERKITPRTKMIIICNPHNPISRVWRKDELKSLGELCMRHNIVMIADEIHSDIVYTGFKHVPFNTVAEEFIDHCIICTAASKTFNLPGLQTSNILIPNPDLKQRFADTMKSCGVPSPGMFGIAATEAAYRYGEEWLHQLLVYLEGNIAFLKQYMAQNIPGARILQPQGTYLLWVDFSACGIAPEKLGNFVRDTAKVAMEPGFIFGGGKQEGCERMNIACPRALLEQGLSQIAAAVRQLRQ
jgi:cystathionine beta-lyase